MLAGRAHDDAGSEAAIEAADVGERATPRMIPTDGDRAAFPEYRSRCRIAAAFPAEHRMRTDEGDFRPNARARGLEDRLFDAADFREDRTVPHQGRDGSEQCQNLANRRAEHHEVAARQLRCRALEDLRKDAIASREASPPRV